MEYQEFHDKTMAELQVRFDKIKDLEAQFERVTIHRDELVENYDMLEEKLTEAQNKIAEKNAHAMACHLCQTGEKLRVAVEALESIAACYNGGGTAGEALKKIREGV